MTRLFPLATFLLFVSSLLHALEPPKPIKVVVITMYELGADQGDAYGEMQLWLEHSKSPTKIEFPMGERPIYEIENGVLVVNTGGGVTNAATTLTALSLDARFDFSNTYWLVAGIAGGDPQDSTLGSAVWAKHVVDGDLLYEIDAREIPEQWPYGLIPLGAKQPNDLSDGWTVDVIHFPLNSALAQWAYETSAKTPLFDTKALAAFRAQYQGLPKAQAKPRVQLGDTLSSSTYWHGERLNHWANDWLKLHAGAKSNFVTSNMEDSGTMTALRRASDAGKLDINRVMILRTVSNFTMPPAGKAAAWSTTAEYPSNGFPALQAAHRVGSVVVDALLDNWAVYENTLPSPE